MEEKDRRLLRLVGSLSTVGIAMVASTVIGYYLGQCLDRFFKTYPWCTIIFLLLGIAAGFKNLFDQARKVQNLDRPDRARGSMTHPEQPDEHSAHHVVSGVTKKTILLTLCGAAAAIALQLTLRPDLHIWIMPAGVIIGGALGAVNFRWLAYAVERVYLKQGSTSLLSNIAAAIISVLKLSVIFIVLFIVIKWNVVHLVGLVSGLSLCFLAILWQGFGVLTGGSRGNS